MPNYYWCQIPIRNLPNKTWLHYVVHAGTDFTNYSFNGEAITLASFGKGTTAQDIEAALEAPLKAAALAPGQFYKRMWRGQEYVAAKQFVTEDVERDSIRFARMLTDTLRTIFRYVEPRPARRGRTKRCTSLPRRTSTGNAARLTFRPDTSGPE